MQCGVGAMAVEEEGQEAAHVLGIRTSHPHIISHSVRVGDLMDTQCCQEGRKQHRRALTCRLSGFRGFRKVSGFN